MTQETVPDLVYLPKQSFLLSNNKVCPTKVRPFELLG